MGFAEGKFSRLKILVLLVINLQSRYGLRYPRLSHMSDERIEKTKSAVDAAGHIPADKKAALSEALSKLKPAIGQISETHPEHAESIARLVEASAHEATRQEKRPEHLKRLSHELRQSVENFEASHPKLAAFVNEYSTILSALGF
jgi:ABC-type transporter Mla subunit MlaD